MKKEKIIGLSLGVLLFIVLVAGITYAYMSWSSANIKVQGGSKCFNILYDNGGNVTGDLIASTDYKYGLVATVKMNVDSSCNIKAKGVLYLNTLETTSSNLYREGLLNYQLVADGEVTDISGNITSSGEIAIDLGRLNKNDTAATEYTVYVWANINLMENSDLNSAYYGNIRVEAIQYN